MCPYILQKTYSTMDGGSLVELYPYHTYGMVGFDEIAVYKLNSHNANSTIMALARFFQNRKPPKKQQLRWTVVKSIDLKQIKT